MNKIVIIFLHAILVAWRLDPKAYIGVHAYQRVCEQLLLAPQTTIVNGLKSSTLSLRHRNLGPLNVRPLAVAMTVTKHMTSYAFHSR